MTTRHESTSVSARDRILDAAEGLICTCGIAGFTLDAVAQTAGVSKGGLLYHFGSKDSLISGLQRRMALRLEQSLQDAERRQESILEAFIRELRQDYEAGGRRFAPLLLAREQQNPCQELQALMACVVRRSDGRGGKKATLLLLASLGMVLSSLARLPCTDPQQAAELFDEIQELAATVSV
ncbi:TetR/AcrR family transcriptional regulator [Microvirga guangxiensis]|uniref:Transcriptional regulator, TetR family n=1 Tax=Microvirga guangxiensis TaxID=549386 RepID=A0A1G5JXV0_9HYPH|nr:TetR/AcrR family transcriptional regulator [Microvirga guangxiensis]SCY93223.1 transcriptional regulator, TetR family [Microvirga guangxiensis]